MFSDLQVQLMLVVLVHSSHSWFAYLCYIWLSASCSEWVTLFTVGTSTSCVDCIWRAICWYYSTHNLLLQLCWHVLNNNDNNTRWLYKHDGQFHIFFHCSLTKDTPACFLHHESAYLVVESWCTSITIGGKIEIDANETTLSQVFYFWILRAIHLQLPAEWI